MLVCFWYVFGVFWYVFWYVFGMCVVRVGVFLAWFGVFLCGLVCVVVCFGAF